MLLILANAVPQIDGDLLVKLMAIALALGQLLSVIARLSGRSEKTVISPQPLVVTEEEKPATRVAFGRHVKKNEEDHAEIMRAGEKRGDELNAKLDQVLNQMGEMKGQVGELKGKVSELTRRK